MVLDTIWYYMYINKWFLNAIILIFTIIRPILTNCFLRFRTHSEMYGVHPKPISKWGLVQFCPQCTYSHLHYHNAHLDILSMKTEKNESQGDLSAIHETCPSFFVEQSSIGHIFKVLTFMQHSSIKSHLYVYTNNIAETKANQDIRGKNIEGTLNTG